MMLSTKWGKAMPMAIMAISAVSVQAKAETKEVVLRLQENVTMDQLAKSVTDPASPRYQQYYTSEEIRALAAPSDADYQALLSKLKADGVQIVDESPTHLYVRVRGERAYLAKMESDLHSTFHSLMAFFSKPTVVAVNGLKEGPKRQPRLKFLTAKDSPKDGTFNGMTPDQIHAAYGFNALYSAGINGVGEDIAIATYNGFYIDDINAYYTQNNVTPAPVVDQVAFNGVAPLDLQSAAETQTDAEFSGMIAPGANIHIYASAENSDAGELAMFTKILDDGKAKIVNYSWGACESQVDPTHRTDMDTVFARAVAQGVNVMVATGDSGSDCVGDGTTVADFPAAEPNVVAVGGTTLALDANGVASETAWSGSGADGGSGGGISTIYGPASFQTGLAAPYNAHRSYPDVAFNAAPQSGQPTWIHYDPTNPDAAPATASYVVIGGTSIAAPQWSGFLALVNKARGNSIGFINPIIYAAAATNQASYFNDITDGNNGAYTAGAGWDAVTGWGSMKADALLAFLKTQ